MRLLCVHCHFHQPPRENPYLGLVPIEPSAQPFENWNERIFRESYLPNMYAHYLREGKIVKLVNNYERISFNFTCSLLFWLQREKPWFVDRLRKAGRNAIASGFNHTILPLDPEEDREIQIVWGIRAFERIFGRKPRGFWLPELAVDKKTLSLLYRHGIRYVILAPHQVRGKGTFLRCPLPEGHMDLFIYDGELSHQIAFGDLINHMEEVIRRTREGITLIAVDGETFGHHKKFGELGLAYLIEHHPGLKTLEEIYDSIEPQGEGEVVEFTSWSCVHGVERWRSNCGCSTGGMPDWHQKWRAPMREALEKLRTEVKRRLKSLLENSFQNPREALFDFVDVLMGEPVEDYLKRHAKRELSMSERRDILRHLYAYKYVSYAFSSDGWFFADISGIEAVKNLLFAKRAMDLLGDARLEQEFLEILKEAPSNVPFYQDGLTVWQKLVLPQVVSKKDMVASLAVLELSDIIPKEGTLGKYRYRVEGSGPWRVYIKDMETQEETEEVEDLKDFSTERVPQPLLDWLLNRWSLDYLKEELQSGQNCELLLEDLLSHAHGKTFETGELVVSRVEAYLKLELYLLLRDKSPLQEIKKVLQKAERLGLYLQDEKLKFWIERYIARRVQAGLSQEEVCELALFVKDYNRRVASMDRMVDLWELQNWAWEHREGLSRETLELLGFLP